MEMHKQSATQTYIPKLFHTCIRAPALGHLWAFPQHLQPWSSCWVRLLPQPDWMRRGAAPTPWRNLRTIRQNWEFEGEVSWGSSKRWAFLRCSEKWFCPPNTGCLVPSPTTASFFQHLQGSLMLSTGVGLHLLSLSCNWHIPGLRFFA